MDEHQLNYLLVANKIDETGRSEAKEKFADMIKVVFISAKEKLHTEVLKGTNGRYCIAGESKPKIPSLPMQDITMH